MEPSERKRNPIICRSISFPGQRFADPSKLIDTVIPKRTFLEKAFLLHEEFIRNPEEMRSERMSRHLYDLERMMDTDHCSEALKDKGLYLSIIKHRATFTRLKDVDYYTHLPDHIDFIPPEAMLKEYASDYSRMQESMIFGDSLPFDVLIDRLTELRSRFRQYEILINLRSPYIWMQPGWVICPKTKSLHFIVLIL
jgi:hypothetical protein